MNALDKIIRDYPEEAFFILDGFDNAIIGFDQNARRLVYDMELVIDILVLNGMEYDDATEYYDFKICAAYFGDGTPIFVKKYE